MDKDEQAPSTPPETPEVEKAEPAKVAEPEVKITTEPKVEEPKTEPLAGPAVDEAPAEEKKDIAAEMERLLNEEESASSKQELQPVVGRKHNHVAIIIILSLLVLAAVGFAIFEYLTAQNIKCDCPTCEQTECKCEEEKKEEEEALSKDYIYISEWGIKIKIGEDITLIGMHYVSDESIAMAVAKTSDKKSIIENQAEKTYIVFLTKSTDETYTTDTGAVLDPVYSDGKYNFFAIESTGYYLDLGDDELSNSYLEANEKLAEVLNGAENYSEI